MNASKENCDKAAEIVAKISCSPQTNLSSEDYQFLADFLDAAHSKLPKEESFVKDKKKRRAWKDMPEKEGKQSQSPTQPLDVVTAALTPGDMTSVPTTVR